MRSVFNLIALLFRVRLPREMSRWLQSTPFRRWPRAQQPAAWHGRSCWSLIKVRLIGTWTLQTSQVFEYLSVWPQMQIECFQASHSRWMNDWSGFYVTSLWCILTLYCPAELSALRHLLGSSCDEMVSGNAALCCAHCLELEGIASQLLGTDIVPVLLRHAAADVANADVQKNAAIALGKLCRSEPRWDGQARQTVWNVALMQRWLRFINSDTRDKYLCFLALYYLCDHISKSTFAYKILYISSVWDVGQSSASLWV